MERLHPQGAISVNNLLTLTPTNATNPDRPDGSDRTESSIVVKTHNKGREVVGLEVGASNARRYFSKDTSAVEFELDHLQIECRLAPDFWDGAAEIRDPRLCAWLAQKNFNSQVGQSPLPLAMVPSGKNSFRLQPLPVPVRSQSRSSHASSDIPLNAA